MRRTKEQGVTIYPYQWEVENEVVFGYECYDPKTKEYLGIVAEDMLQSIWYEKV